MCWLCGEVGHKVAECGGNGRPGGVVDTVEEVVVVVVVADVGGVWTVAGVEQGWTKVGGLRRSTKKEAALRRRSMGVAVVHKNKFRVLVVDPGDQAVCTIEAAVRVWEVEVAHVSTEITIDSAAEESVCPEKWAEAFGRLVKVVNASGGRIEHCGNSAVTFNGEGRTMEAKFEVINVTKPLMAVVRVVDAGSVVQFGPMFKDNFIVNVGSKEKVCMCTCEGKATALC